MNEKKSMEKDSFPTVRAEIAPRTLRAWVELIGSVSGGGLVRRRRGCGEVLVRASRDGLRVIALAPDGTVGVDAIMAREACEAYECPVDGDFAVDLWKLGEVAKLARPDQLVRLELDPAGGMHLTARMGHLVRTCGLVSGVARKALPPQSEPQARAIVSAESWAAAVKSATSTGNQITLASDGATVTVGTVGEVDATTDPVDASMLEGHARAIYAIDTLGPVARAIARAEDVRIAWSTDGVLQIAVQLGGRYAGLSAVYLHAPRVEEPAPEVPEIVELAAQDLAELVLPAPAAPEPVSGDEYPAEIVDLAAQDLAELVLPAPTVPEVPEPAPIVAAVAAPDPMPRTGAPDCAICLGWGRIYSRTRDYGCPGCGGTQWVDRRVGPTLADVRDGCVDSVVRAYRLATGRDAS